MDTRKQNTFILMCIYIYIYTYIKLYIHIYKYICIYIIHNPPAPLVGAPPLQVWDTICFSTVIGPAFSCSAICTSATHRVKIPRDFCPATSLALDLVAPRETINFQRFFQGNKIQKTCSQGLRKTRRIDFLLLQGAPEVPKWFPWVPKWGHQASQITTTRS